MFRNELENNMLRLDIFLIHRTHSIDCKDGRREKRVDFLAFFKKQVFSSELSSTYHKGWLPRAKLRPLVKIRLARPIRGQHFRSSFFSFWSGLIYWYQWGLLLRILFMNNAWTLLYLHFHWKKTECFRVRKTWNVKVKLQDCWGRGAMKRGGKGRG